jgi:MOSC domain-containing protein YiiM
MSEAPVIIGRLRAVLMGKARPYTRAGSLSAIDKQPRDGAVMAGLTGLEGDEQGDPRVHGGPDKAVHCYTWAHYGAWQRELPGETAAALLRQPGAFGENFSLEPGLDETNVCIADQWAVGDALFEVSQGRQPCWKLNDRFGVPDMARRVQQGGHAGWYLRVLRPGLVQAGDAVRLVARPHPDWTLARLLSAIAERNGDPRTLKQILALPLPPSWAKLFRRRLETGQIESWALRLDGEGG